MSYNTILATAPLTTTNFILKATGTTIGNSLIFDNGTNVGIGTASPTNKLTISNDGNSVIAFRINDTNANASFLSFNVSNTDSAIIAGGTSGIPFDIYTGGVARMRITSGGDVGIGNAGVGTVRFAVFGAGTTSATYSFSFYDSGGITIIQGRNDGAIFTGTKSASPYNNTTGTAANLTVLSDGSLARSTSSLKYKNNVENYTKGLAEVIQLRPVSYEGKSEMDSGKTFAGLIAEEVHDLGLTEFVQYAEDGTPDALAYSNMIALLTKAIQEMNTKIIQLEKIVATK